MDGEVLVKADEAARYGVNERSIQRDIDDIPEEVRKSLTIIPVRNVKEEGLCPTLCQYFKVTDSGKEEYFRLRGDIENKNQEDAQLIYRPEKRCLEYPTPEKGYKASPFFFVENILNKLEAKQLSYLNQSTI